MLYQRVRELAKHKEGSVTALSDKLGMIQATFNGYLKESRQNNLWAILPKILNLYPDISRDWLYFGEGNMLKSQSEQSKNIINNDELSNLKNQISELKQELKEEHKLNRQLTTKLLIEDNPNSDGEQSSTG